MGDEKNQKNECMHLFMCLLSSSFSEHTFLSKMGNRKTKPQLSDHIMKIIITQNLQFILKLSVPSIWSLIIYLGLTLLYVYIIRPHSDYIMEDPGR